MGAWQHVSWGSNQPIFLLPQSQQSLVLSRACRECIGDPAGQRGGVPTVEAGARGLRAAVGVWGTEWGSVPPLPREAPFHLFSLWWFLVKGLLRKVGSLEGAS